ncbi:hypothetical protein IW262DRAFT_1517135 [Armillaria fumosa]|nr:hypothetical protein IW262DRAFT_1517135 [Armillaria fumosa]
MSETAAEIVWHVQATRYLTSAGLVVLLYDHLLTFSTEVELIWAARWSVPKALFLLLRYIVPPSVIIHTHLLSGIANSHMSNTFLDVPRSNIGRNFKLYNVSTLSFEVELSLTHCPQSPSSPAPLESLGAASAFHLLYLGALYPDNNNKYRMYDCRGASNKPYVILGLFSATYLALDNVYYDQGLRTCAMRARDRMPLLWAPCIAFEIVALSAMVYNALSRPRSLHTDVGKILYRDGIAYFLILFSLRLMNLLLASVAPVSLVLLGVFFIWSSTTVTVTRLILNLRELRIRTAKLQNGSDG